MITSEFDIDDIVLLHREYDPEKAREYYLRTRQLKGRKPGAPKPLPVLRRPAAKKPIAKSGANIARKPLVQKKMGQNEARSRVASIQKRLSALNGVLKGLLAEKAAQAKKSSAKKTAKPAAKSGGSSDPKRKLTAKQKADNNKRAKEYYEKNKPAPAPKKTPDKSLDEKIAYTRSQIKKVQGELAVAKAKAGIK